MFIAASASQETKYLGRQRRNYKQVTLSFITIWPKHGIAAVRQILKSPNLTLKTQVISRLKGVIVPDILHVFSVPRLKANSQVPEEGR